MDTAWIQIFILTMTECVAPVGKTVCQEQQFELQFISRKDCEYALQQMVDMKDESDHVIVIPNKTGCSPTAVEQNTFGSLGAINAANKETSGWRLASEVDTRRSALNEDYNERLKNLMSCEETSNVAPCKIGDIIVEDANGDSVDVWKQDKR
jgi:hypothetical protein